MPGNGSARALALTNSSGGQGNGVSLEFGDRTSQYALISSTFDNASGTPRESSLKFAVRSADNSVERLRLSGRGIGFFGASPVARPVIGGSRGGNSALASLLSALASLGLVTDSSSS
jgi:hypothetical protein